MGKKEKEAITPRGKVVCMETGCYWVTEDEEEMASDPSALKRDQKRQDASLDYSKMVTNLRYEDIPPQAVEATKTDILDTLSTTLAGSSAEGTQELIDQVKYWGGREESSILVHGSKVPSPEAALVNSQMAHARDYDDVYHLN